MAGSTTDPTASAIITADLEDGVALNSEVIVLIIGEAGEIVTNRRLLAQLKLDWRVQQTPTLVVNQVVSQAHNNERYIVVARVRDTLKAQALINKCLSYLAQVVVPQTKLVDALDNLVLSVAPVDAIRGQYEQVIVRSDGLSVSLWL